MSTTLTLHRPSLREMSARAVWLNDPLTMAYNAGSEYDAPGYDRETGCIEFTIGDWRYWRDVWLYREPNRYAAFLQLGDGTFVGEVCYYFDMETESHGTGIIIHAPYRGKGYGTRALRMLCEHAFEQDEVEKLTIELPILRDNAVRMYLSCGFREEKCEDGLIRLVLEKEKSAEEN